MPFTVIVEKAALSVPDVIVTLPVTVGFAFNVIVLVYPALIFNEATIMPISHVQSFVEVLLKTITSPF
ncbi:MAG: hypothetical protein HY759_01425 [Nitrospirae bacterium]|nr:hypothetical protein [Nitrospirota bacterium]